MKYQTIERDSSAEMIEKKSKFIANLFYVETKQEAEIRIRQIQKQYHDAKHHCFAYRIYDLENEFVIEKSNDDGEPAGTAGSPILKVLNGNELVNVLVIVTRYFGGILLGTGGLTRCYKMVTQKVLEIPTIQQISKGNIMILEINYQETDKFDYFCKINQFKIINKEYSENIKYRIEIEQKKMEILKKAIEEKTFKTTRMELIGKKMIKSDKK